MAAFDTAMGAHRLAIRNYALETFSPDLMVQRYEAVYRRVAAKASGES